jgi:predicted  nucleic acid-binding Zn-ribbon protein
MLHKCVKCGKLYEHSSEEILNGCTCGAKLFYFVKSKSEGKKKKSGEEICQDVEYFYELEDDVNKEIIIFDIESINIKSSGKYELNIDGLMNNNNNDSGLIYKYGEGKYSIDLENNFKQLKKKR